MTKVLLFVDRLRHGGIQQLIIEILKNNNTKDVQFDVLVFDDGENYPLENEVKTLGANLYKINGWINSPLSYFKQKKVLDRFYKEHNDYKAVHLNSSSKNFLVLREAKKYGIPVRVAHSHNIGFQTKNKVKVLVGNILKKALIKNTTDFFACSENAGVWLYGKDIVKTDKFKVIHNAIDYERFKFDEKIRKEVRKSIGVEDNCLLFGNVGRFTNQKNHTFLIDIFYEIYKKNQNSKLMLVGIGEKEEEIKQKVDKLNLEKNVLFLEYREDVNRLMQGMDAFIMPSLYEGFPVVCVEAQAAGVPCFLSKDVITNEVKIADNVNYISLDEPAEEWASQILKSSLQRLNNEKKLKKCGFFIQDMVDELVSFYKNK